MRNDAKEVVGVRGFKPENSECVHGIIDFEYRGRGYQLSGLRTIASKKAEEGYTELRGVVMAGNRRQQRALLSLGFELEPHPDFPNLLKARCSLDGYQTERKQRRVESRD